MNHCHTIPHSKPTLSREEESALAEVIRTGYIASGRQVERFECALAEYIGVKGGVALNSGTSALHLALLALGLGENDSVIIPGFSCCALLNAVYYTGAKPVLVDIDPHTFNLDIIATQKAIGKNTKAIIVPHMFGLPADLEELCSMGIPVIEDCAQALGATYQGKKVGSFGILSVFSFYATKVITTGEGGMLLSNSTELLEKIRDLHHYDQREEYKIRYNYKMTDLQAAMGRVQLNRLPQFIADRQKIAQTYLQELKGLDICLPHSYPDREHIFYRFIIQVGADAEKSIAGLKQRGINCARPVYKPLHHYLGRDDFPLTEAVWKKAISLPIYPTLGNANVQRIINEVKKLYAA